MNQVIFIIDGDRLLYGKESGFIKLRSANSGYDVCSITKGHMNSGAANAAKRAQDENSLSGCNFNGSLDELCACGNDQGKRGSLHKTKLVGDRREHIRLGGG